MNGQTRPALRYTVKNALSVTDEIYDDEVDGIISACMGDLKRVGVRVDAPDDALIVRAVILYAKANFGFDPNSEKFYRSYASLRDELRLSREYRVGL